MLWHQFRFGERFNAYNDGSYPFTFCNKLLPNSPNGIPTKRLMNGKNIPCKHCIKHGLQKKETL